jgi:nicotinate-nucleotide--dimethylbenzimidazole phosphoribosyltransferase
MIKEQLQHKIDFKTKPLGALGQLERIALQVGTIQQSLTPSLKNPHIVVFAGDHGIVAEGVSAYPQEVSYQMVLNFLNGGAGINVFAQQHNIALKVVDAGVNFNFEANPTLIHAKLGNGTASFLTAKAMTSEQLGQCLAHGAKIVSDIAQTGCNIIGFGEMGIGNTSSASMLMSTICQLPLGDCVGRGTGLNNPQLVKKLAVLSQAQQFHGTITDPLVALETFGGFEIAQMVGAFLQAHAMDMVLLVDGFIASSAFLVAQAIKPEIKDNALFCHVSEESGHKAMLDYLGAEPILNLGMRLGEGTGCAVAYPIVASAVNFLNNMASFESAGVSNKD